MSGKFYSVVANRRQPNLYTLLMGGEGVGKEGTKGGREEGKEGAREEGEIRTRRKGKRGAWLAPSSVYFGE